MFSYWIINCFSRFFRCTLYKIQKRYVLFLNQSRSERFHLFICTLLLRVVISLEWNMEKPNKWRAIWLLKRPPNWIVWNANLFQPRHRKRLKRVVIVDFLTPIKIFSSIYRDIQTFSKKWWIWNHSAILGTFEKDWSYSTRPLKRKSPTSLCTITPDDTNITIARENNKWKKLRIIWLLDTKLGCNTTKLTFAVRILYFWRREHQKSNVQRFHKN